MNTTPHLPVVFPATLSGILVSVVLAVSMALYSQSVAEPAKQAAPAVALAVDVSAAERVKPALPVIPDRAFNLADFGGIGDGRTMNTDAFKRAIAAVEKVGGGRLVVPKGVFRTAPFALCSRLDLHLDAGAVIKAPETFEELGLPHPSTFKTQAEANARARATPASFTACPTARSATSRSVTSRSPPRKTSTSAMRISLSSSA